MAARNSDWFWDGPNLPVTLTQGDVRFPGRIYSTWTGGIGVRLEAPVPTNLVRGSDLLVEVELAGLGGAATLPGSIRLRGTGCHDQFLSIDVSTAFSPTECSEESIAIALGDVELAPGSARVTA